VGEPDRGAAAAEKEWLVRGVAEPESGVAQDFHSVPLLSLDDGTR
jgi:hypothetical protein